ncbi:MAG: glycosyltransferase family 2 protein [Tatlockia sp.]|nr:glycosyltransferase family 2 protein [Tatlockia sp.]
MQKEKVFIIIPTYNEASVIADTVAQVFAVTDNIIDFEVHVLIFDSASTDNTQAIIAELQTHHRQLHFQKEREKSGLGSAYLQAMRYAMNVLKADIVFEFDADLSHQPKYLAPMLEKIKTCDVVVGSRYVKGGSIPQAWGFHRKLFSILGNYVARTILTPRYKDFTSGFRATRCQILKKVLPKTFLSNHFAYKLHLLWLLHKSGVKIAEQPIEFIDREKGQSKLPANSIIDSLFVVFTLRYFELKRYLKMCLVGVVGMGVQFIVYNLLRDSLPPFNATQFAVLASILNNFILNTRFTFKSQLTNRPHKLKRLTGFIAYSIVIIYLQSYWLKLGIYYLGEGMLRENSILALGIALLSLLNYFTYSRHIWPESKKMLAGAKVQKAV